ncbi:MAG: right-handed parallel beta-helix repeat-containing protein, partial [Acidobacteriota bacterium]
RLNGEAGFNLGHLNGEVTVTGSLAERNDGAGFALVGSTVEVTDSQSDFNGGDGWVIAPPTGAVSLVLANVMARGNGARGVSAASLGQEFGFATAAVTAVTIQNNANQGLLLLGQDITLDQLTLEDNGGDGLTVLGQTVTVDRLSTARNVTGALILAGERVTIQNSSAVDNQDGGLGLAASDGDTATATASGLVATGNTAGGLFFGGLQDATFASLDLVDLTVSNNTQFGVGGTALNVVVSQVTATDNEAFGVFLEGVESLDGSFISASGHTGIGINIGSDRQTRLTDSTATANVAGIAVSGPRTALERVTASLSGPDNGNLGSGSGFFFFNARDLEVVDAISEQNLLGWTFLELQTQGPASAAEALGLSPRWRPELSALTRIPGGQGAGPQAMQRITLETSSTLANQRGSLLALLSDGPSFRVSCSDFIGNGPDGFEPLTANFFDARANYWGDAAGPTHPDNPGGAGDVVNDSAVGGLGLVNWAGFLTAPATADDCPEAPVTEVPALGSTGRILLILVIAAGAIHRLRRRTGGA